MQKAAMLVDGWSRGVHITTVEKLKLKLLEEVIFQTQEKLPWWIWVKRKMMNQVPKSLMNGDQGL